MRFQMLTAAALIALSGHAHALPVPPTEGDIAASQVKACAGKLTIRAPVGKVTLSDAESDARKVIECGRPLAEFLFASGVGAAESVDYANWFAFASQQAVQFHTTVSPYRADTRLINKMKGQCAALAGLQCVYDFLKTADANDDDDQE
jgi:hypothetical protein